MIVKTIIEITGDFEENLHNNEIEEIVNTIINDGAEANCCSSRVVILEVIES